MSWTRALPVLYLFVLASIPATTAELLGTACWQRNCLERNDAGAICLTASANGVQSAICSDETLSKLLTTHLSSVVGLSIAYYTERGEFLGSATWPLPPAPLPFSIFVCMSGKRADLDGAHRTLCRLAVHDDDQRNATAHVRECSVEVGQLFVVDGCYVTAPRAANVIPTLRGPTSFLDQPTLLHIFFVLGGIVTVGTFIGFAIRYRKQARDWARRRLLRQDTPQPAAQGIGSQTGRLE